MAVTTALYDPIKTAAKITDRVLVGVSCGKDSIVTLDLCFRFFKHVQPFFMYIVPGLGFQERTISLYERKYGVPFLRVPHFMLAEFLRYGTLRQPDLDVPMVSTRETYNYLREQTGIFWIACGERISDSIVRRAMIRQTGSIDDQRGRFFPIAYWAKKEITGYLQRKKLPLSEENRHLGFSFRSLLPEELLCIKEKYPEDYQKICEWFPMAEASVKQGEFFLWGGESSHE